MLLVGLACSDDRMISAGLEALDWLMKAQRCETNGHFVPIGSQGFYHQGGEKARFDQQPIEAAGAVSACLEAYRITGTAAGERSMVGVQLVPGRQRSATSSLRFRYRRLPGRLASRTRQSEPGSRIDAVVLDGTAGNALADKTLRCQLKGRKTRHDCSRNNIL